jgi:uncharacterized protein (DUF488 family)
MYFKITPIQKDKYVDMGMINVSADLYLEKGDEGYHKYITEHDVTIPIIPEGGYQGEVDEDGAPIDQKDYDKWIKSLETVKQLNPFCNHSIQFEPDVTEEEILWCFEFTLAQTHLNYLEDDLHCQKGIAKVVNKPFGYSERRADYKTLDATKIAKIVSAESKVTALKDVDFTQVETVGKYKVK